MDPQKTCRRIWATVCQLWVALGSMLGSGSPGFEVAVCDRDTC